MAHDRNFEIQLNIEHAGVMWSQMLKNCFFALIDIFFREHSVIWFKP